MECQGLTCSLVCIRQASHCSISLAPLVNFLIENNFSVLLLLNVYYAFTSEEFFFIVIGENTSSFLSKNRPAFRHQNILLGTTYQMISDALSSDPNCLTEIEENKAQKILELSGYNLGSTEKVMNIFGFSLYAFFPPQRCLLRHRNL